MHLVKDKKVFGWVMYDWANSAFATTVMAGFFPVFFKSYWSAGADVNESTALLGIANSIASLVVALIAPILGAIADQSSSRKKMLIFFAYMGALLTGCLFLVNFGNWLLAAVLYVLGTIGFSGANIFYDALLPEIADRKKIDCVSSKGFALGYLGGGLLFLINVLWFLMPDAFGLPSESESSIEQELYKGAKTIQIATNEDFSIPDNLKKGRAIITSSFVAPIEIVSLGDTRKSNWAVLKVDFPANLNIFLLDSLISFGGYKKGTIANYNLEDSTLILKDLTREIAGVDSARFVLRNEITFSDFRDRKLLGVEGLENHFGEAVIKSSFLSPAEAFLSIRLSFLSVALWWGIFTIPLIAYVKERKKTKNKEANIAYYIRKGFWQLGNTFSKIRHLKVVFTFLIAYWLYIDGVDTVIRMAVDYGMSIGFPSDSLIVALLITQFVGFPCALLFGKLSEKWDVKKLLFIAIGVYLIVVLWGVMMTRIIEFYILAIAIGFVQGGIQALSRSYYSRLIPKEQSAEFYGFYNMLGKLAAIFGPAFIGIVGILVRNAGYSANVASRAGIGSIAILFIIGGILLFFVDKEKGEKEVKYLSIKNF
jgi:MFS-type transporter involved in bile tolerance (Atg22 family)